MNIYEKMMNITAELNTVAKNLTVQASKTSSYKAVSERDILDAVKPLEEKYKVYSYPVGRKILESHLLESESTYNGNTTKKTTYMTRIETTYRFVNAEKPDEYIETTVFSEGIDTQDKGSGKAMTYGDKYALMKVYKISTGDDPDQEASGKSHFVKYGEGMNNDGDYMPSDDSKISEYQLKALTSYKPETQKWVENHFKCAIADMSRQEATEAIKLLAEAKKRQGEISE